MGNGPSAQRQILVAIGHSEATEVDDPRRLANDDIWKAEVPVRDDRLLIDRDIRAQLFEEGSCTET